jgi:hypothetical protein
MLLVALRKYNNMCGGDSVSQLVVHGLICGLHYANPKSLVRILYIPHVEKTISHINVYQHKFYLNMKNNMELKWKKPRKYGASMGAKLNERWK